MPDEFAFRPRKKAASVYFNIPGSFRYSIQVDKEHESKPNPKLVTAIGAAFEVFWQSYYGKPSGKFTLGGTWDLAKGKK